VTASLLCMMLTTIGQPPADPLVTLYAQLSPETQARLGPLADLRSDGHELANVLLQPLFERGPISAETIAAKTTPDAMTRNQGAAELVMQHKVSLLGGYERQELGEPIDWLRAPKEDWQWPTHLSRHYWLLPAAWQYRGTGDAKYAAEVIRILLAWVAATPIHAPQLRWGREVELEGHVIAEGPFQGYGDGPWTSLSAHARFDTWSELFVLLWDAPAMDNAAAATLLHSLFGDHRRSMLAFPRAMNQGLSIANSLIHMGLWYRGVTPSAEAEAEGWKRLTRYATNDIYPDGSMAECSPNYAAGSLKKVSGNGQLAAAMDRPVPDLLRERVALATRYFALISDPGGHAPRIAKGKASVRGDLQWLNDQTADPSVAYVASGGASGTAPAELASLFPWAGHAVMRSDWTPEATWLFIELGPRGSGHHDLAQLGLQLQSAGEWLLTDPGYYTYSSSGTEGEMYRYLNSTFAHNTATVDDLGQVRGKAGVNAEPGNYPWQADAETVRVESAYTNGYGPDGALKVIHRRTVTYHRSEDRFEVVDRFEGEGTHTAQVHWQLPPNRRAEVADHVVRAAGERATLRIVPACAAALGIAVVAGQQSPLAGWYSETYGALEPTQRITVAATGPLPLTITTQLIVEKTDRKP